MKWIPISLTLALSFVAGLSLAQDTVELPNEATPVEVVNDSLKVVITDTVNPVSIVGPMFYPSQLRSLSGNITAKAGKGKKRILQFNETVTLQEFTFAPLQSAGACQIQIRINDLLAKVLQWQPPGAIVGIWQPPDAIVEQWEPPGAIVGIWQPPGGIVQEWEPPDAIDLTPNDYVTIRLQSLAEEGEGACSAKYVVLATTVNGNGN
jgi:hypothetical protein